jgi:hypothetical protein
VAGSASGWSSADDGKNSVTSGRFFAHFFRRKSHSEENSVEFLGKMIFQNFFRGKIHFFPTFFWEEIFRGIFPKILRGKNVQKIGPMHRFLCGFI